MRNLFGRMWWVAVGYCFLMLAPAMAGQGGTGTGDGIETDKTFSGTVTGKTNGDFKLDKPAGGDNATGTFLGAGTVGQVGMPIKAGIVGCDKCKGKTIKVGFWGNALPNPEGAGIKTGAKGTNLHFGGMVASGVQNCPTAVISQVNTVDQVEFNGVTYKDLSLPKLDTFDTYPARLTFSFGNDSSVAVDFPGFDFPINQFPNAFKVGNIVGQKKGAIIVNQGQTVTRSNSFITAIRCSCDPTEPNPVAFIEWTVKVKLTLGNATTTTGLAELSAITIVCPTDAAYATDLGLVNQAEAKKGNDRFTGRGFPDYTPQ